MVQLTREYIGGICAGFGLGLMVGSYLSLGFHPLLAILGFLLITVGGVRLARHSEET